MEYTRKHPRKNIKLRVHCTGEGLYFSDTTINMSEGGVGLETVSQMKPGAQLRLEFFDTDGNRVSVKTEVVWVTTAESNSTYSTGLEFRGLSDEQRDSITYCLKAHSPT